MIYGVCGLRLLQTTQLIEVFLMNTLLDEILMHTRCLRGADVMDRDYNGTGLTELEYHMAEIVNLLLTTTNHGRLKIQIRLAKDFAGLAVTK